MKQAAPSREQISLLLRAANPHWRLVRTWPLQGALSATVSAIEVEQGDGGRLTIVLRQYGAANLQADPHAAVSEYRLLRLLSAAGLPVPRPYYADESCAIVSGPCLLQEFIDGERLDDPPDLSDFAGQLAAFLAGLHDTDFAPADVGFLADVSDDVARRLGTRPSPADEFLHETAVRAALTKSWPPRPVNPRVILHGDYWPGNVLWRNGNLAGVIDWEDALLGDPLADLSIARLELGWLYGPATMNTFTRQYLALRPGLDTEALPLWDLRAALRAGSFKLDSWGLPAANVASMRAAHREFAASALRQLGLNPDDPTARTQK